MSVGNLKDNGNKGNNFPYQLSVLKLLGQVAGSGAGSATEATALAILAAIQNGQEFEQNLIIDTGGAGCPGNCPTYLQIRIFNTETHTFDPPIYYDAAGAVVVPVGPLELVNPQYVLDNILVQVTAINAASNTDNLPDGIIGLSTGGKAVDTATYAPAYTAGDFAKLALDKDSGHLLVQGNTGGFTAVVSSNVTMSVAGIYSSGDYMGTTATPQSIINTVRKSGSTGIIKSLIISDKILTTNVAMELWIIDRTFTAPTDNAAWDLSDANMLFVQAVIPIAVSNWYASSAGQVYVDSNLSIPIKPSTGTSIFYALVARGTTPSFTTGDLNITLGILQD